MASTLLFPLSFIRQYSDSPLDASLLYQTKVDLNNALSEPTNYAGMIVSCVETNSVYILNSTKTAWIEVGGSGMVIVDDYSQLPTTMTSDAIYFVKNSYEDTSVTPSVTYSNGFYLWDNDLTIPSWVLISTSQDSESIISIDETELITIKEKTKEERQELYKNNILFVVGDSKLVFYNRNLDSFVDCKTDNTEVPLWQSNKLYKVNDLVKYNEETYKCIVEHTSGETFDEDEIKWIIVLEQYYALKQSQYDKLVNDGVINDNTRALYVITNATEQKEDNSNTIQIVNTLPTPSKDIENFVYFLHTDNKLYKCVEDVDNIGTYIMKDVTGTTSSSNESEDINYTNDNFEDITNSKQALDKLLDKVFYVEPSITSFTMTPSTEVYENGESVSSIDFSWEINKVIKSQTLTDCILTDENVRSSTYNTPITSNKTFTLTINDGEKDVSESKTISFKDKIYWGNAAIQETYDSAFILGLANNDFADDNKGSFSMNLGTDEYGFIAFPKSFGSINSYKVFGFEVTVDDCGIISFTNTNGYTCDYYLYKTTQSGLGEINPIIE